MLGKRHNSFEWKVGEWVHDNYVHPPGHTQSTLLNLPSILSIASQSSSVKRDTKDKERKVKQNGHLSYGSLWDAQWKTMQGFQIPPTWDIVYRCINELPFASGTFVSDIVQSRLRLLLYNYLIYLQWSIYFQLFAAKTNKPKPLFVQNPNRILWPTQDCPSKSKSLKMLPNS